MFQKLAFERDKLQKKRGRTFQANPEQPRPLEFASP